MARRAPAEVAARGQDCNDPDPVALIGFYHPCHPREATALRPGDLNALSALRSRF